MQSGATARGLLDNAYSHAMSNIPQNLFVNRRFYAQMCFSIDDFTSVSVCQKLKYMKGLCAFMTRNEMLTTNSANWTA